MAWLQNNRSDYETLWTGNCLISTVHDFHNFVINSPTGQKESKHNNKSESDYLRLLGLIIVNCTQQWWWSIYHCWILIMKMINTVVDGDQGDDGNDKSYDVDDDAREGGIRQFVHRWRLLHCSTPPLLLHFSSTSPPLRWLDHNFSTFNDKDQDHGEITILEIGRFPFYSLWAISVLTDL